MKSVFFTKTFLVNLLMAVLSIIDIQFFGNMIPLEVKPIVILVVNTAVRLLTNQPVTFTGTGKG